MNMILQGCDGMTFIVCSVQLVYSMMLKSKANGFFSLNDTSWVNGLSFIFFRRTYIFFACRKFLLLIKLNGLASNYSIRVQKQVQNHKLILISAAR